MGNDSELESESRTLLNTRGSRELSWSFTPDWLQMVRIGGRRALRSSSRLKRPRTVQKCAESPPPVVMFGERIIALQLAARGLSRGHSKYKKVLLVGACAPVSSAPEGEHELFLRNLQAAVESEH